jgi:hypothetical protein
MHVDAEPSTVRLFIPGTNRQLFPTFIEGKLSPRMILLPLRPDAMDLDHSGLRRFAALLPLHGHLLLMIVRTRSSLVYRAPVVLSLIVFHLNSAILVWRCA